MQNDGRLPMVVGVALGDLPNSRSGSNIVKVARQEGTGMARSMAWFSRSSKGEAKTTTAGIRTVRGVATGRGRAKIIGGPVREAGALDGRSIEIVMADTASAGETTASGIDTTDGDHLPLFRSSAH